MVTRPGVFREGKIVGGGQWVGTRVCVLQLVRETNLIVTSAHALVLNHFVLVQITVLAFL